MRAARLLRESEGQSCEQAQPQTQSREPCVPLAKDEV